MLLLQEEILRHIPHTALLRRPALTQEKHTTSHSYPPYVFASHFYGVTPISEAPIQHGSYDVPFASAFKNLITLNTNYANNLLNVSRKSPHLGGVFSQSLLLLDTLVRMLDSPVVVSWNPSEWLCIVLRCIERNVSENDLNNTTCRQAHFTQIVNFEIIDRAISLLVALHEAKNLAPKLSIGERSVMDTLVNKVRCHSALAAMVIS